MNNHTYWRTQDMYFNQFVISQKVKCGYSKEELIYDYSWSVTIKVYFLHFHKCVVNFCNLRHSKLFANYQNHVLSKMRQHSQPPWWSEAPDYLQLYSSYTKRLRALHWLQTLLYWSLHSVQTSPVVQYLIWVKHLCNLGAFCCNGQAAMCLKSIRLLTVTNLCTDSGKSVCWISKWA